MLLSDVGMSRFVGGFSVWLADVLSLYLLSAFWLADGQYGRCPLCIWDLLHARVVRFDTAMCFAVAFFLVLHQTSLSTAV